MPAGDLITKDDQYEVNGFLIGDDTVHLGEAGVTGWDDEASDSSDAGRDLADGASSGFDSAGPLDIRVPALIVAVDEAAARAELKLLKAAWRSGGYTDVELHRQVAGSHEYVVGRTRGCTPVMTMVRDGMIPVLCHFFANDPTIHEGTSA